MTAAQLAPAKVNLFLHVGAPDSEGYHPLVSLMTFADIGDVIRCEPADSLSLAIEGPFADGLSAGEDNLVLRAARALLVRAGRDDAPFRLILDKQLPIASGLGGGSSDAGAALRLLDRDLGLALGEPVLEDLAAALGADGAPCLRARPVLAQGRGERLSRAPRWPFLPAVLVNPGVPSPTGAVYRAYDQGGVFDDLNVPVLPDMTAVTDAAACLAGLRNDLEAPAVAMAPVIGEVLDALRAAPEALLARMSGSGATCFVICADDAAAGALAARLRAARPGWWTRACTLG